ncbi:MAG: hypothetical protein mread185_000343 [Mycoplasmataceae bacterium]|nr:MAG: hypothetical protein mread185_000343 [Mycoplasmataceae bacterium]
MIEDTNGNLDFNNETVQLLKEYVELKKAELRGVRADQQKNDKFKKEVKFFGLDPNKKLTFKDLERLRKDDKLKKILQEEKEAKNPNKPNKSNQFKQTKQNQAKSEPNDPNLLDLDQINQDLADDE